MDEKPEKFEPQSEPVLTAEGLVAASELERMKALYDAADRVLDDTFGEIPTHDAPAKLM